MSRFRDYSFTDFTLDEDYLGKLDYQYLCYGLETCPETGKQHLQGYIYFKNAKSFRAVKKLLPTAHLERSNGSTDDNVKYCSKEGKFKEFGDRPKQGARNDINEIKEKITTGQYNMRDIVATATSYQSIRLAEVQLKYFEPPRNEKTEVLWFFGETGTGKTRDATAMCEDPYICMEDNRWWEGYDGHEDVIIDDYRRDFCKFRTLLRILDRYEHRVECKGGSRQLRAKRIIITSSKSPRDLWEGRVEEDLQQLFRRISQVRYYRKNEQGESGFTETFFSNQSI